MSTLTRRPKQRHPGNPYGGDIVDRDEFGRQQIASLSKALSAQECACKEKHIRCLILGSHQERGCGTFWSCVHRIQIESSRYVSWKFCYVLHKLCRDGHPNVLADSVKYKSKIAELGKLWQHLQSDSYGQMIHQYSKLLIVKIKFHANNRSIGGNLQLTDAQIESLGEHDVNNWFELAIEMLDYLDEILQLEVIVFDSMDLSRSNSLTAVGQCRLSPLIPCIIDSSCLYDYLVKMLFKLHGVLPADILLGHRQRFNTIFVQLKKFYATCNNIHYFKHLVTIPKLPDSAPNLLSASAFDSYVPMHAEALETASMMGDDSGSVLVDLDSRMPSPEPVPVQQNHESDVQLASLRSELDAAQQSANRQMNEFQHQQQMYETRLHQMNAQLEKTMEERDNAMHERLSMQASAVNLDQLTEAQKLAASQEERYRKMRDVYMKVRAEHIATLTKLGELQRAMAESTTAGDELRDERSRLDEQMQTSASHASARLDEMNARLAAMKTASSANVRELLAAVCTACSNNARDTMEQYDHPAHLGVVCPPEFAVARLGPLRESLAALVIAFESFANDEDDVELGKHLVGRLVDVGERADECLIHAYAVAHAAPTDKANELSTTVRSATQSSTEMYATMAMRAQWSTSVRPAMAAFDALLERLGVQLDVVMGIGESDVDALESLLGQQMDAMNKAIALAASRIEEIRNKSRQHDQGVKLELNADILDQCTELMSAVQELVRRAKYLQGEIVEQGRGTGSVHDFYKRNHKWSEGLLSAANESADGAITGTGKFEALMVASREVAASTAQLVVASNVKADRASVKLSELSKASKVLTQATASVIGSVKSAQQTIDEQQYDFSGMTMHAAKQLEFEAQVRVMELESSLTNERKRLGELRRQNYREGEETVDSSSLNASPQRQV